MSYPQHEKHASRAITLVLQPGYAREATSNQSGVFTRLTNRETTAVAGVDNPYRCPNDFRQPSPSITNISEVRGKHDLSEITPVTGVLILYRLPRTTRGERCLNHVLRIRFIQ